ncbi:hypothetical protein B484DRAFT_451566 [Ochromonadaceae sp. CCMP2298]|nr:hypothetical protein B484DRAFT_451566 [Ochromonadaceae sp. CCMP2298]|mmetsp:Transcript_21505/g.47835  ORF Transcript_21505/g.47835 Transcript_21505/m.47835 type:complete len:339 (-) Transcript_21505:214-1230(-)
MSDEQQRSAQNHKPLQIHEMSTMAQLQRFEDLMNGGAINAMAGRWRASADSYRAAYEFQPETAGVLRYKYNILSALCSTLVDGDIAATEEDLQFLRTVRKDVSRPSVFRCKAAFTRGLCLWYGADKEGAARSYRHCINIGDATTAVELKSTMLLSDAGKLVPTPVGPVLIDILNNCRDNLASLECRATITASSEGHLMSKSFGMGLGPRSTTEEIARAARAPPVPVGHSACAACGTPGTALLQCSGCKRVSYCNSTCQVSAWREHKIECCKAALSEGDHAVLIGLQIRPELNGERVVLRRLVAETGRWEVGIVGSDGTMLRALPKNLSKVSESAQVHS